MLLIIKQLDGTSVRMEVSPDDLIEQVLAKFEVNDLLLYIACMLPFACISVAMGNITFVKQLYTRLYLKIY